MTFQIGDLVRLRGCSSHQRVTKIESGDRISTKYVSSGYGQIARRARDFEHVNPKSNPKEDHTMNQNTLFQTKEEKPRYGTYIATNPEGRVVLVMDTGYEDFDLSELDEVIPHTVEITFTNGQTHHYTLPAGSVEVGDLVVTGIHLGRVTRLNSKNRNPKTDTRDLRQVATSKIVG